METLAQVAIEEKFKPPFTQTGPLVSVIIANAYIVAGILLLILLVAGGFMIIHGAGSGDRERTGQGKKAATAAALGFLIIFASYWIIQLIETITGISILG